MQSSLPVRGRSVAIAALAALLLAAVPAGTANADDGGFPAQVAPVAVSALTASLSLDGRTALAPADAPPEVVAAIAAANRITSKPYKWGGGHGRWRDGGYDCSGSVSYVLHAAGLLRRSHDSGGLMSYGWLGEGGWITVYANPGHAYMTIAGLRFDTSGRGEDGPRWRPEPGRTRGYVKRHPSRL